MEKIKLLFLGTGNAIPTEKRNHTAILLTYKNENILIDCGEGTQRQFKIAKESPSKLTKILLTHWHGDHILGLPGLFQTLAMSNYTKTLKIVGPSNTHKHLTTLSNIINIQIPLEIKETDAEKIEEKEYVIESLPMSHGTPCNAYSFILKEKIRIDKAKLKKLKIPNSPLIAQLVQGKDITFNGKKIKASSLTYQEPQKKIAFILDTGLNTNLEKIAKDADILICEATFSKEETAQAKEYRHLTAEQAAQLAKKAKVKKLILTHISQRYEHFPEKLLKEAKKIFKNTHLVKDFDTLEL